MTGFCFGGALTLAALAELEELNAGKIKLLKFRCSILWGCKLGVISNIKS